MIVIETMIVYAASARRKTVDNFDVSYENEEVVIKLEGVEARLHPAEAALVAALISDAAMRAAAALEGRATLPLDSLTPETPNAE